MLTCRPEQLAMFEASALRAYEAELADHARTFDRALTLELGDQRLERAIHSAVAQAGACGLTMRGPVRLFVEGALLFGSAFHNDPQYPWAQRSLAETASEPEQRRAERLFAEMGAYETAVYAADDDRGSDATSRLRANVAALPMAQGPTSYSGVREAIGRLLPEKAAYIGRNSLDELVREGAALAQKAGMIGPDKALVVTTMMFVFGHGCGEEPFRPWIGDVLRDTQGRSAAARASALQSGTVRWLDQALA